MAKLRLTFQQTGKVNTLEIDEDVIELIEKGKRAGLVVEIRSNIAVSDIDGAEPGSGVMQYGITELITHVTIAAAVVGPLGVAAEATGKIIYLGTKIWKLLSRKGLKGKKIERDDEG